MSALHLKKYLLGRGPSSLGKLTLISILEALLRTKHRDHSHEGAISGVQGGIADHVIATSRICERTNDPPRCRIFGQVFGAVAPTVATVLQSLCRFVGRGHGSRYSRKFFFRSQESFLEYSNAEIWSVRLSVTTILTTGQSLSTC